MNKNILFVMRDLDNHYLFTQEEKDNNKLSANNSTASDNLTTLYVTSASAAVDYTVNATRYWLKKYFEVTGEDKQDYINEVQRLKELTI